MALAILLFIPKKKLPYTKNYNFALLISSLSHFFFVFPFFLSSSLPSPTPPSPVTNQAESGLLLAGY